MQQRTTKGAFLRRMSGVLVVALAGAALIASPAHAASPAVTSFSPTSGAFDQLVDINGTGFQSATAVTFNGASAPYVVNSDTLIKARVPSNATSGPVAVTTSQGTGTSSASFQVMPTVSGISPAGGPYGTKITIYGNNLSNVNGVKFGSVAATFSGASATQVSATVPNGAPSGRVTVTTPSGSATSPDSFTVIHNRKVSIHLSGHLSATGRVTVPDGSTGCASGVRVKIQKAVGKHFHTIQEVITNGNGTYNKRLPNVSGFYRAKLPAQSSASGDGCLIAFSKTFAYAKG